MAASLIATKYQIPPLPPHLVSRTRLSESLERTLPDYKLALITAPAGYGKTTCLTQWARLSQYRVAWLSIDEEDDDFEQFFRYLLAGWEAAQPGVMESRLGLLLGSTAPDHDTVLTAFINLANAVGEQTVFVLDDYHLIDDPAIHQAMGFLADHLPPMVHFVVAGRGEPPLSLARYRAHQSVVEYGVADLSFLPEETADFLAMMGLVLGHDEVAALHAQLEGWIAGLQLAALSLRQRLTGMETLTMSGGRQRFIADYLGQDVLAHLPDDRRRFLLQTSILDRLCGSLCDAVTGGTDGQEMLEALEQAGLFLVPLDDRREWYRYHRVFAGFLRGELERSRPGEVTELHRRAAAWYLARDLAEPAFRHALDGQDVDLLVQVFDRFVNAKLMGGEFRLVKQWIDALPAVWIEAYPVLGLAQAGLFAFTGSFEACVRRVAEIEEQLAPAESRDRRQQLARVTAIRCYLACMQNNMQQAESFADRALHELPEEDLGFRPGIYGALGDTYRQNGRWEEAKACYEKALDFTRSPAIRVQSVHFFGALADLYLRQGKLHDAARYWEKALASVEDRDNWGRLSLPVTGWVYIRLGEIQYEWNEPATAKEHLARALERAELGGDIRTLIAGYLLGGRIQLTAGDLDAATSFLEEARPLVENAQFPAWSARFERLQLELWLAQDRLRAAVQWVDAMLQVSEPDSRPEREVAQLATARVLIVQGDMTSLDRAQARLKPLLSAAEEEGRAGVLVEARALQALASWRQGDRAASMTALELALRPAEPEGYIRLFVDLGLPMARLLYEARSRDVMPDYVATLLDAYGPDVPSMPEAGPPPEPLTPREQEVLELMAAGLTNREIGDTLVISPETVKKHCGNIYGKLRVSNRTEAVARARDLDLLA